jgi:curved DNA-binding protein CbpA
MIKNYYKILDVNLGATQNEIKSAYRKLALFWHPDRNSNPIALDKIKEINEAYEILHDENKRKIYDKIYQELFVNSSVLNPREKTDYQYNKEKEDLIKQKYKKEYNDLIDWIKNINFSLSKIDKFIENSISKLDRPIEIFSFYFPILLAIIIIICIIAANVL